MLQLTTIVFLIAFSVLAVIHVIAIKLYLYWQILWLDIPMHFLGGIVVALGLYTLRDLQIFPNKFLKLLPVMLLVLCVAIAWEVYELMTGITTLADLYGDTIADIIMGLSGGLVGFFVGNSLRNLR